MNKIEQKHIFFLKKHQKIPDFEFRLNN